VNAYQPSANNHTVQQRIEDRRAAASAYRLATLANPGTNPGALTRWRCAVGNRLKEIGENLITPKSPQLPTV
jgi:hypothetical protein